MDCQWLCALSYQLFTFVVVRVGAINDDDVIGNDFRGWGIATVASSINRDGIKLGLCNNGNLSMDVNLSMHGDLRRLNTKFDHFESVFDYFKIIIYRSVFIFYLFDKISILPVKKKEIEILKMCICLSLSM